jgi:hypothetical protein
VGDVCCPQISRLHSRKKISDSVLNPRKPANHTIFINQPQPKEPASRTIPFSVMMLDIYIHTRIYPCNFPISLETSLFLEILHKLLFPKLH